VPNGLAAGVQRDGDGAGVLRGLPFVVAVLAAPPPHPARTAQAAIPGIHDFTEH
jgi:hypothetical protein